MTAFIYDKATGEILYELSGRNLFEQICTALLSTEFHPSYLEVLIPNEAEDGYVFLQENGLGNALCMLPTETFCSMWRHYCDCEDISTTDTDELIFGFYKAHAVSDLESYRGVYYRVMDLFF
jgi:hypothetical protein